MLGATLLQPAAPAGASAVQNLQQEAAHLSQQMLLEQLQIGGYQQQRTVALQAVDADDAQLAAIRQHIAATRRQIAQDMVELRRAAVSAYVTGGTQSDATNPLFSSDPANGASGVYTQVMTNDLSSAVRSLQTNRRVLDAEIASEGQLAAAAQRQAAQASTLLADAQSTEATLAQQKSSVTSQLSAAIASQRQQAAAASAAAAAAAAPTVVVPQPSPVAPSPLNQTGGSAGTNGALPALPPFLQCVIQAESGGNYQAVSPTGQYMGAFQFSQSTWNEAAQLAGIPSLVGVPPTAASPRDQDLLAIALYDADGEQPWYDPCRS